MAAILGVSPYKTRLELWEEKRQVISEYSLKLQNNNSKEKSAGHYLEPVIAQMFEDQTGLRPRHRRKKYVHNKHHFLVGHIDRLITGQKAFLECKSAASFVSDEWADDQIPAHYLCQVHFYAGLAGFKEFYIAVLIGGNDFKYHKIKFREDFYDFMVEKAVEFWGMVQRGIMPAPSTLKEVARVYSKGEEKKAVQANQEIEEQAIKLHNLKAEKKKIEAEEDGIKMKVRDFLKDACILLDSSGVKILTVTASKPRKLLLNGKYVP